MQWSLLAAVTLLRATHASEPALRVDASGVVRATLRKGESITANSACVVGCSGRASSGRLLRSTPLVALGRKKRWWQRGLLRKKDSPFAAYSTRADEAVLMVSSSRVGHAACVVDASNSTVVLAERSVLCATPGTELEASKTKSGLVSVKRGAVAVQGPGRVVAHSVPKGGRLDARSQRVVAWTLQSEAAHDAKDWRAFVGPAVVYLASAAPPAPLGRLLRMRASPSKGGLKSVVKGSLRFHWFYNRIDKSVRTYFLSGLDHHLACLGTFVVRLTLFPAAIACRDPVFVFGPCGSNRIFIKSGSQAQGASLGIQLGPAGQNVFLSARKKLFISCVFPS